MSGFFEIVGMVVVGAVLLTLGAGAGLVLFFRKKIVVAVQQAAAAAMGGQPRRITLRREDEPVWNAGAEVETRRREFEGLGFEWVGDFDVEEMCGLQLAALLDGERRLIAVVYDHLEAGVFCDVVVCYDDDTTLTVTSSPEVGQLEPMPGHPKIVDPAGSPSALVARLESESEPKTRRPTSASEFRTVFEEAYAQEIDWRNAKGGPDEQEISRIAAKMEDEVAPEHVAQVREALKEQAAVQLAESCLEQFTRETLLSVSEWEKVRESVVVVHDLQTSEQVVGEFTSWVELPGDLAEEIAALEPSGTPARDFFADLNSRLPEATRYRLLGRVSEPSPADVWAAPV